MQAEQSALQCKACGGMCYFSSEVHALECLSCAQTYDLAQPDDHLASDEFAHGSDLDTAQDRIEFAQHAHSCLNCGGEVVFTGPALSEHCPYCHGPVVLAPAQAGFQTTALIPFRVDAAFAQRLAQDWAATRIGAPRDLSQVVAGCAVSGLYAPFWTFDTDEAVQYWANYIKPGGKGFRIRQTRGQMGIEFDDLLMPASPHVTPLIRDGILHDFNPADLRPYRAGYLAGFAAERHHQSVREGIEANAADKDLLIRNHIKHKINRTGMHGIRFLTSTSGIHYRRILLPVWILHYTYAGQPRKIVVSGIDGRTFGERPFSRRAMTLFSDVVTACTIGLGLIIGAVAAL